MAVLVITDMEFAGTKILRCDECPSKQDYQTSDRTGMNWDKSCHHIETFITSFRDSGGPGSSNPFRLAPSTRYQLNLSPHMSWLCRDMWAGWFIFETSVSRDPLGYSMEVTFTYESDYYNNSAGSLGLIMPEDGRQSVRNTLWDWITNELLKRQPLADQGQLACPQRTHSTADQKQFVLDASTQEGINAHCASIVFENCCCYCYRKTMGQDANFGFDDVQAPRRQSAPVPVQNTVGPLQNTNTSGSAQSLPVVVNVPNPNYAPPPWHQGGNSA